MRQLVASAFIGLVAFSLALGADSVYAEEVLLDSPGTGTFIVPNNVNELAVELWGAGGAGGDVSSGGGGGGAYRSGTLTVNPGESLPYHVGRGARSESEVPGETSWFGSSDALSAGGGSSARNRGTRQGGSGSNAGTYAGGDGGSGAWLVGGGGGSSAGREQDGNPGSGSSPGNAPAGGGDGGAGGGSIFIFGGSGEPGEQPGGGGGGAGSGLFGGGSGGSGGDGLIRVIYTAEGGCDASFPDGISSYNGGNIDFGYNSQLIGSPDGTLSAGKISRNGGSNLGTCGSVDCEAGDSAASPLNLPPFPAIGAPAGSSVWVGYSQSGTVGGGGNRFESISTGYLSTLTFSGNQDTYYIGALNLGSNSQVYLRPGDYYIESISINSQVDVQVLGAGTARLFIKNNVDLGSPSLFNSPGVDQAGDSSKLLLASYSDVNFQNNATLSGAVFALGDINLGSSSYLYGGATAENITLGTDSRLYFQDQGLSNIDFGGTCPGGGDEVVDHFEIVHGGTGLTCSPASVTIRACDDASCSQTFSKPVAVTLAPSGWVGGDTFTFTGQANRSLRVTDAGTVSLGVTGSDPGSEGATLCGTNSDDLSRDNCEMTFYDSGFAISVPDHVADTEVQATIAAVRKNKETEQCVPGFSEENKDVALWFKYVNPSDGNKSVFRVVEDDEDVPLPEGGADDTTSLYFDENGSTKVDIRYPDAGRVQLHARHDGVDDQEGLVMLGDGNFVARPARFEALVIDNPGELDLTPDGRFKIAGEPFEVEVRSLNASGNLTPNFGKETPKEAVFLEIKKASDSDAVVPELPDLDKEGSEGQEGFRNFGESCAISEGGKACGEFSWKEVGAFALKPVLVDEDENGYLGTEGVEGTLLPYVGRFWPKYFDISIVPGVFSSRPLAPQDRTTCTAEGERGWVYTGEPFGWKLPAQIVITPKNANDESVENYRGTKFQLLDASDVKNALGEFPVDEKEAKDAEGNSLKLHADLEDVNAFEEGSGGALVYFFDTEDQFRYPKSLNARVRGYTPNPVFTLERFEDGDGVTAQDPNSFFDKTFEPDANNGFKIRYGRITLDNAYGPENIELAIPLTAEVYGDSGFEPHQEEICWFYDLPEDVKLIFDQSELNSTQTEVVSVPDSELTLENAVPKSSASEDFRLRLTPPGTSEDPKQNGVRVLLEVGNPWLKDYWDSGNPNALVDPYAWATFGVYRGNDRIIYWHEVLN